LRLVREDLGPDASVLHTRDVASGIARWLGGAKEIEVTASAEVEVPSRIEARPAVQDIALANLHARSLPTADELNYRSKFRQDLLKEQRLGSALHELCEDRSRKLKQEISVRGPIWRPGDGQKVVAFAGPTGVGKTTSIAKLAADFALRQRCRVGLVTVDSYRIAAVEQLRTYAEIMDLPFLAAATPYEMQQAIGRMSDLDLVLVDTAGRSPLDDDRMAELHDLLSATRVDEAILVLSAASGLDHCRSAAGSFHRAGCSSLLLTKLDEAVSLSSLAPLLCDPRLPVCYVTDGQNVPEDICLAEPRALAQRVYPGGAA